MGSPTDRPELSGQSIIQCSSLCSPGSAPGRFQGMPRCPAGSEAMDLLPRSRVTRDGVGTLMMRLRSRAAASKGRSGKRLLYPQSQNTEVPGEGSTSSAGA